MRNCAPRAEFQQLAENCSVASQRHGRSSPLPKVKKGDRCVLLAANSIAWAAFDLAAMSAGIIVVPLYARQSTAELAAMMRDCQSRL